MGALTFKAKVVKAIKIKRIYRPMIRSRHPSHHRLRVELNKLPFRSVIRLGSTTGLDDPFTLDGSRIELNSIEAIKNSSSKLKMKECFKNNDVKTAIWTKGGTREEIIQNLKQFSEDQIIPFPIVAKNHFGSRGKGNTLIKSEKELNEWFENKRLRNYIFEKFCNFNKEYRLHVSKNGCFYSCRKMLKPEFKDSDNAWQRHDDNCVWILEQNESFDKPSNWDEIVEHCVKALESCGLDFGACDLRVQNNIDAKGNRRERCDFIVVEINSAPSFGEITFEKYKVELENLLIEKHSKK